jgi:hypothetical protein
MDNIFCSAVAFVHFYFSAAGALWWLVLCFAWFLVTTLKWGEAPVGEFILMWNFGCLLSNIYINELAFYIKTLIFSNQDLAF